jgi:hypothetical protein
MAEDASTRIAIVNDDKVRFGVGEAPPAAGVVYLYER